MREKNHVAASIRVLGILPRFRPAIEIPNLHFLRVLVARRRRRAWIQGARWSDSAGVLDGTSRNPTGRNAVDMPGYVAAIEPL